VAQGEQGVSSPAPRRKNMQPWRKEGRSPESRKARSDECITQTGRNVFRERISALQGHCVGKALNEQVEESSKNRKKEIIRRPQGRRERRRRAPQTFKGQPWGEDSSDHAVGQTGKIGLEGNTKLKKSLNQAEKKKNQEREAVSS